MAQYHPGQTGLGHLDPGNPYYGPEGLTTARPRMPIIARQPYHPDIGDIDLMNLQGVYLKAGTKTPGRTSFYVVESDTYGLKCSFSVDELCERVDLIDSNLFQPVRSLGGLVDMSEVMKVNNFTNQILAEISEDNMNSSHLQGVAPILLTIGQDDIKNNRDGPALYSVYFLLHSGRQVAKYLPAQDGVFVQFRQPTGINENVILRINALFLAIKLYYAGFKLGNSPIPNQTLAHLPAATPDFPSLNMITNMTDVIMRIHCKRASDKYWIDILDNATKNIMLVVAISQNGQLLEFNDQYGIVQFRGIQRRHRLDVASYNGERFSFSKQIDANNETCYDNEYLPMAVMKIASELTVEVMLTCYLQYQTPGRRCVDRFLFTTIDGSATLAEIYPENFNVHVDMSFGMTTHAKAMVLTKAAHLCYHHYLLYEQVLVSIPRNYPFRPHYRFTTAGYYQHQL